MHLHLSGQGIGKFTILIGGITGLFGTTLDHSQRIIELVDHGVDVSLQLGKFTAEATFNPLGKITNSQFAQNFLQDSHRTIDRAGEAPTNNGGKHQAQHQGGHDAHCGSADAVAGLFESFITDRLGGIQQVLFQLHRLFNIGRQLRNLSHQLTAFVLQQNITGYGPLLPVIFLQGGNAGHVVRIIFGSRNLLHQHVTVVQNHLYHGDCIALDSLHLLEGLGTEDGINHVFQCADLGDHLLGQ